MATLLIGCGLGGCGNDVDPTTPFPKAVVFVAGVSPVMSALYHGQTLEDVADYATTVSLGNFTSSAGAITSVEVTPTGDATAVDAPLSEGQAAGYVVTVTDDQGNEHIIDAGSVVVEYKAMLTQTASDEVRVELNPLVPGSDVVSGTISGSGVASHNGAWSALASDLRNSVCYLRGLDILGTTGLGDTLTCVPGIWASPDENDLTFSYQWKSNGLDIAGATGATFDITASERGTDLTVEVTADDGANGAVSITSVAVPIPGGHGALGLIYDSVISTANDGDYNEDFSAIDWSAANEGDTLVLVVLAGVSGGVGQYTAAEIDGVSMTQQAVAYSATEAQMVSIFTGARPAAISGTINISGSGSGSGRPKKIALFGAGPYDTLVDSATANGDAASQDISVNTTDDCLLIAGSVSRDSGTLSYSGVTERDNESFTFGVDWEFASAFDEVSSVETPRSVTSISTSPYNHAAAAITLVQS